MLKAAAFSLSVCAVCEVGRRRIRSLYDTKACVGHVKDLLNTLAYGHHYIYIQKAPILSSKTRVKEKKLTA